MARQRWLLIGLCFLAVPAAAQDPGSESDIDFFGDFRLRLEQDWDSRRGDGTYRDDRLRLRIRLRGGLRWHINDAWSAKVEARSGNHESQQSPHVTIHDFDDGPTGPYDFDFSYWYLNYARNGFTAWAGRNQLMFWRQDDMLVHENVTFPGMGAAYRHALGQGALTWNFSYVALPAGMRHTSGEGASAQLVYDRDFERTGMTVAGGVVETNADPGNPDGNILLTDNNTRDYRMFTLQFQLRTQAFGTPLKLGLDYAHNAKDYDDAAPGSFSEFHRDDVDGYVASVLWGKKGSAGNWLFGYYYAHLEALALNSSYISDDWVRWGNAPQVRATNLKGSEFRVLYTIKPTMNVLARLYLVDAIDLLQPGDATTETGNRFRIDFNASF